MEKTYYFDSEKAARNFSWGLLKLPNEKVKIDKVLVAGVNSPYGFEITVRYWSEETEELITKINSDCSWDVIAEEFESDERVYEEDDVEITKEIAKRDALLMGACSVGMGLKVRLIDDPDGCNDVDDLVHTVALAVASTSPGPSLKTLNFVLDIIGKKEGYEYYA